MTEKINFIGFTYPPAVGSRVKNYTLIKALKEKGFDVNLITIEDPSFLFKLITLFFEQNPRIIFSCSIKLRTLLSPYLYLLTKVNGAKIILIPVGGRLAQDIQSLPDILKKFYILFLSSFDQIYIQTHGLKKELCKIFPETHISRLDNFKYRPKSLNKKQNKKPFDIVYLGRVEKEKGILDLFKVIDILEKENLKVDLHIYGPLIKGMGSSDISRSELLEMIKDNDNIYYHGSLEPEKINETISAHDVFVFPTHYETEGFPGVFLDAFFAGLPIVAYDSSFNHEIITDGMNGFLCEPKNPHDLAKKIKKLYDDRNLLSKISNDAFEKSKRYDVMNVLDTLISDLKKHGWFD